MATTSSVSTQAVIVTGLAAAGQHELAERICALGPSSRFQAPVGGFKNVEGNNLLYTDGEKWIKVSSAEFVARVRKECTPPPACMGCSGFCGFVYESTYGSGAYLAGTDPREQAIDALIKDFAHVNTHKALSQTGQSQARAPILIVVRTPSLVEGLERLMERVMGRASGAVPQGAKAETPHAVAVMVADYTKHFDENNKKLLDLARKAAEAGWDVRCADFATLASSL